ncbi:MAG: nucleotidyltransferase domain-containing protein [Nanoarchaeota archaeon]|nr:nucleotidyltransferase domain-containing protein [Nanoarchaeota archaeon]
MSKKKRESRKKVLEEDYDIAYDFAVKAYSKFQEVIKSIALFGSVAKRSPYRKSDIDVIIIVDDCTVLWDEELIAWYRESLALLLAKQKYKKEIHINTVTLSAFWKELKEGDPVVINILRYGIPLVDHGGFFSPLKILLRRGKIRPTAEAIYIAMQRAPMHLSRSRYAILGAIEGLYWGMVDAAHAALMSAGHTPPSPEHVYDMLKKVFGKKLHRNYAENFKEMYTVAHNITHGNIKNVSGKTIDSLKEKAENFVEEMKKIVRKYS